MKPVILALIFSFEIFAAQQPQTMKTIPFMINPGSSGRVSETSRNANTHKNTLDIPASELSELVTEIKDTICKGNHKTSFRFWVALNASAKVAIIADAGGETGLEITVQCQ